MDSLNLQLDGRMVINFNSVEDLPGYSARAAFTLNSSNVFRVDTDILPVLIEDATKVVRIFCNGAIYLQQIGLH